MLHPAVDVLESGAVLLGRNVVCDGYAPEREFRVQTHTHDDHMADFDTSKGTQDVLLSPETLALLVAEYNADLPYRDNLIPVQRGTPFQLGDGSTLLLQPSNHMLGSCQVALTLSDGRRLGYSGDFGWPLNHIIEVDELVIDSTYGSPASTRLYTQAQAEAALHEVVVQRLRHGPVHLRAHRGTVERVLQVLGDDIGAPILASPRLIREAEVHQKYGFAVGALVPLGSDVGMHAMKNRAYLRLYSKGDGFPNEITDGGTTVVCSAFMADADEPLKSYSSRAFSVALSNHADFADTLAYVEATGADTVVTDNTRNHGIDLAVAISQALPNVLVKPSTNQRIAR